VATGHPESSECLLEDADARILMMKLSYVKSCLGLSPDEARHIRDIEDGDPPNSRKHGLARRLKKIPRNANNRIKVTPFSKTQRPNVLGEPATDGYGTTTKPEERYC
jgi:hypothetical protein